MISRAILYFDKRRGHLYGCRETKSKPGYWYCCRPFCSYAVVTLNDDSLLEFIRQAPVNLDSNTEEDLVYKDFISFCGYSTHSELHKKTKTLEIEANEDGIFIMKHYDHADNDGSTIRDYENRIRYYDNENRLLFSVKALLS